MHVATSPPALEDPPTQANHLPSDMDSIIFHKRAETEMPIVTAHLSLVNPHKTKHAWNCGAGVRKSALS